MTLRYFWGGIGFEGISIEFTPNNSEFEPIQPQYSRAINGRITTYRGLKVDLGGFEPPTSSVRLRGAPNCAISCRYLPLFLLPIFQYCYATGEWRQVVDLSLLILRLSGCFY